MLFLAVLCITYLMYTGIVELKGCNKRRGVDKRNSFIWAGMLFIMSSILMGMIVIGLF